MTITYPNGTALEALLLARGNDSMRAAVPGDRDVRAFLLSGGNWFSESSEPVKIEFAWGRHRTADVPKASECVCPEELASKLKLLFRGNEGDPLVEDAVYVVSPDRRHFPFKAATLTAAP